MDRHKFNFFKETFSIISSTAVIYTGILAIVWKYSEGLNKWQGEVGISCIWIFLLTTASTIIEIPFSIYYSFVLEEKYDFNKMTAKFFAWDKFKGYVLGQILTLPISALSIVIIKYGGDWFFLWLWITVSIIALILAIIYPSVIAPIFDKFTPLPEGELRTSIENLAAELKFPLKQLYVIEGSKRSSHSNAYFYGFFKSKQIVLFDTLLEKPESGGCNNEEILAILSHELGHWNHMHVIKNLFIVEVNLFLMFTFFSVIFRYPLLYKAVGFENSQPILAGLLIVMQYVMIPYNNIIQFIQTCLSRRFEYQADEFAVKLNKGDHLKRALIQLNKDNLGFPFYDRLYSAWYHSHPPLLERLEAIDVVKKN